MNTAPQLPFDKEEIGQKLLSLIKLLANMEKSLSDSLTPVMSGVIVKATEELKAFACSARGGDQGSPEDLSLTVGNFAASLNSAVSALREGFLRSGDTLHPEKAALVVSNADSPARSILSGGASSGGSGQSMRGSGGNTLNDGRDISFSLNVAAAPSQDTRKPLLMPRHVV